RALGIEGQIGWPVGAAVAARVEGDDARVASEVGDLRLPEPRVHHRPGRHEGDRPLPLAVHLVVDTRAVAAHRKAIHVGMSPSALLWCRLPSSCHFRLLLPLAASSDPSHPSIQPSSAACPRSMLDRRSSAYPCAIVTTSDTAASTGNDCSRPYSRSAGANASLSTTRHSSATRWMRRSSSGRFHARAWSSSQTFE